MKNTPEANELGPLQAFTIMYPSDSYILQGYLLLPKGEGPFATIIFQHGSSGLLPSNLPGIEALKQMGYAIFIALRRGHNSNPGPRWL